MSLGDPPPDLDMRISVVAARGDAPIGHVEELLSTPLERRTYLGYQEFAGRFGARPADIAAISRFAHNHGLHVIDVNPGRRTVTLGGTACKLCHAFNVDLKLVRSRRGVYHVPTGPIQVPKWLRPSITGVFGFDNRPQARTYIRAGQPLGVLQPLAGPAGTFTPPEAAQAYHFPAGDGAGETIAIIELSGGYRRRDLQIYFNTLGVSTPQIEDVPVDGGANLPTGNPTGTDAVVTCDIEVAGAIVPKSRFFIYFAPNTEQGFINALSTAIHDEVRKPSIVSVSWGAPRARWSGAALSIIDDNLQDAAALGVSVICAGADVGQLGGEISLRSNADFPVSSLHHRGVGVSTLADLNCGYQILVDDTAQIVDGPGVHAPLGAALVALLQQNLRCRVAPIGSHLPAGPLLARDGGSPSFGANAPVQRDPSASAPSRIETSRAADPLGGGDEQRAQDACAQLADLRTLLPNGMNGDQPDALSGGSTASPVPVAGVPLGQTSGVRSGRAKGSRPRRKPNVRRPGASRSDQ
jgi:hypothetical protein